jgi:hypothetical protein
MSGKFDDNLDSLGADAQHGLQRRVNIAKATPSRLWPAIKRGIIWGVIAIAFWTIFSQAMAMRALLLGVSTETKLADAQIVLEAARQAVEGHRTINRTLPQQVPLSALAALVRMESTSAASYRLIFESNSVRASMDASGNMTTDTN